MEEIVNAKITYTKLGKEDHGILTFFVGLEFDGGGVGFGGYALDSYDKDLKKRVCVSGKGLDAIVEILDVIGVDNWEDLPGNYCRIKHKGWGGRVDEIGNIIKNKWFNIREHFEESKNKTLLDEVIAVDDTVPTESKNS